MSSNKSQIPRRVTIKENPEVTQKETNTCRCPCTITSVNVVAAIALITLGALSYVIAMATKNWSASGYRMKMGLWDFCVNEVKNNTWSCFPVNTEFSVATQAFSILAAMCYCCLAVLYVLYFLFSGLQKSRALIIGTCLIAFAVVSLQIMTLIVYGTKHGDLYHTIDEEHFKNTLDVLYLSWSYYFAIVSTILATVSGVLLFLEFKHLAYQTIYQETVNNDEQVNCGL
ncbi:hypothetical protein ACF0H5_003904 [Mactra antiquata]